MGTENLTSEEKVLRQLLIDKAVDEGSALMRKALLERVAAPRNTTRGAIVRLLQTGEVIAVRSPSGKQTRYYVTHPEDYDLTTIENIDTETPDFDIDLEDNLYQEIIRQANFLGRTPEEHITKILNVGLKAYKKKVEDSIAAHAA